MRTALIVAVLAAWSLLASVWGESSLEGGCAGQPGGCVVTPQTDAGFGMDPDGKPGS
jgi:hypothetical protein